MDITRARTALISATLKTKAARIKVELFDCKEDDGLYENVYVAGEEFYPVRNSAKTLSYSTLHFIDNICKIAEKCSDPFFVFHEITVTQKQITLNGLVE